MANAIDPKIIKWAKASGNAHLIGNRALIEALYAENNKAKKIGDLLDGMQCEMRVLVVKHTSRKVRLCSGCYKKACKDSCGQEDYQTMDSYSILVGDQYDKVISMNLPPWYSGEVPEKNHAYLIRATAKTVGDTANLELTNVEIVSELEEGQFKIKKEEVVDEDGVEEAEAEETETEDTEDEPVTKSKPTKKPAPKEEDEAEEEVEEEKPVKSAGDPKLQAALKRVKAYFNVNDGARTPKQLEAFMTQQGIGKFYQTIVKTLKLSKNDDGEFEYVE